MSKKKRIQDNADAVATQLVSVPGVNRNAGCFLPLEPLNHMQGIYMRACISDPVIICTGVLGSAKTYIPTVIACDLLRDKKIQKIVVARQIFYYKIKRGIKWH